MAYVQWSYPSRIKFFKKVWNAIFLVILWSIWKERNERIFQSKSSSSSEVCNLILLRLGWWINGWKEPFPYSPEEVARTPACLRWIEAQRRKPSLSNLNLQIEEINSKPKIIWRVGVSQNSLILNLITGGILKSSQGRNLCAFSGPIPYMDSNSASILAIHRAIQITINNPNFSSQQVIIESDSMEAVRWCISKSGGPDNMQFILRFIRSSLEKGRKITISHEKRSSQIVTEHLEVMKFNRRSEFVAWM